MIHPKFLEEHEIPFWIHEHDACEKDGILSSDSNSEIYFRNNLKIRQAFESLKQGNVKISINLLASKADVSRSLFYQTRRKRWISRLINDFNSSLKRKSKPKEKNSVLHVESLETRLKKSREVVLEQSSTIQKQDKEKERLLNKILQLERTVSTLEKLNFGDSNE